MGIAETCFYVLCAGVILASTHYVAWMRGHASGRRFMGKTWGPMLRRCWAGRFGSPDVAGQPRLEGDDGPDVTLKEGL